MKESTRPSAELTLKQAIQQTKEWQESDELAIAPEIITALLDAADSFDTLKRRVERLEWLLSSWEVCMREPRPSDWEAIVTNLLTNTASDIKGESQP